MERRSFLKSSIAVMSMSAAVGGDIGWVTRSELSPVLSEAIGKMNRYTSLGVARQERAGASAGYAKAFFRAAGAFLKAYIFQLGFLDGGPGLVIAVLRFENSFYKHAKLIEHRLPPGPGVS